MKFISNEFEYRQWIMDEIFQASAVGENSEFADQEVDDFIFDARPVAYPCVAVMIPTPGEPGVCEPRFFYKEQIFEWAHKMGFGFDS
ncbi:hypothetical protein SRABI106_04671 [Rahnella aquatilis]|nr:hypothetical protein SRABI106_04671 [Rahnella aquatilis]